MSVSPSKEKTAPEKGRQSAWRREKRQSPPRVQTPKGVAGEGEYRCPVRSSADTPSGVGPGDWRNRGGTRSKAAKALRGNGLRAWHGLVVVALNHMYGHRPDGGAPVPGSQATGPQEQALSLLWNLVKEFIDEKETVGVPRTSQEDWGRSIDSLRVSYTGEVLEKAVPLTLEQVLPGLPSVDHGAMVDILEVLPAHLQEVMQHPERLMLEPPQGEKPRPRVRAVEGEWPKIAKAMMDRGLV
eukprot:s1365_g28.t1